jgi:hypothetical protein
VISKQILSFDPAQTIKKLLDCAERRSMQLRRSRNVPAKQRTQGCVSCASGLLRAAETTKAIETVALRMVQKLWVIVIRP